MSRYIALRILHSFVVVIGVVTAVFILLRLSGDPIRLLVPPDATPEHVERIKEIYGLNDPIHIQYVTYIARAPNWRSGHVAPATICRRCPWYWTDCQRHCYWRPHRSRSP